MLRRLCRYSSDFQRFGFAFAALMRMQLKPLFAAQGSCHLKYSFCDFLLGVFGKMAPKGVKKEKAGPTGVKKDAGERGAANKTHSSSQKMGEFWEVSKGPGSPGNTEMVRYERLCVSEAPRWNL